MRSAVAPAHARMCFVAVPCARIGAPCPVSFACADRPASADAADAAERAVEGIKALRAEIAPGERPRFAVVDDGLAPQIRRFASRIMDLGLPPSDFLIEIDPARFLHHEKEMNYALKRLAGSGHRILAGPLAVSSFSAPELERMGAPFGPAVALRAAELLLRMDREYAENFSAREAGGIALSLFTPWTTLDDLHLNLDILARLDLADLIAGSIGSRVRLFDGDPAAARAVRDGLAAGAAASPSCAAAHLQWRFRDPEVGRLCQILAALAQAEGKPGDALPREARPWLRGANTSHERLRVARGWLSRRRPRSATASRPAPVPDTLFHTFAASLGPEPVRLLAPPRDAQAGPDRDLPGACAVPRTGTSTRDGSPAREAWSGPDPERVEEAVAVADFLDRSDGRSYADLESRVRLWVLRGAPPCCAQALALDERSSGDGVARLQLRRRLALDVPVRWELNPFAGVLDHVPCSLKCRQSIHRAERLLDLHEERHGARARANLRERGLRPFLFLLDRPGESLELIPEGEPGERFRYRAGARCGEDPRLALAAGGDTLVVEEGCITALAGGRRVECFRLDAHVWWWQRPFATEFFRTFLRMLPPARKPVRDSARRDGLPQAGAPAAREAARRTDPSRGNGPPPG